MTASNLPAEYRQRIVAFIDVLGFGSLILDSAKNDILEADTIKRASNAIDWSIEALEELMSPKLDLVFTQFSDSFVISIDAEQAGKHGLLMFSFSLLYVIDRFLSFNLLLRGGITSGKLIHTTRLLFGPAMNRAYELESRMAKVPRIILDPSSSGLAGVVLDAHLVSDSDGLRYVDYFTPRKRFFLVPSWQYSIQCAIEAVPSSPALQEKKAWLIEKYNAAISDFSYEKFKSKLDAYVDDTDADNAVVEDYEELLAPAKMIHQL